MHACMHACMHAYMHTCIHAYMHTCIHAYMHACMHACIHACMHACIHTYIHTSMHACMHTYIHTYIHTPVFAPGEEREGGQGGWATGWEMRRWFPRPVEVMADGWLINLFVFWKEENSKIKRMLENPSPNFNTKLQNRSPNSWPLSTQLLAPGRRSETSGCWWLDPWSHETLWWAPWTTLQDYWGAQPHGGSHP